MPPLLMDSVLSLLERLRVLSGMEIRFEEREGHPVQATVSMAGRGESVHRVLYRTSCDDGVNHAVASGCLHLLRLFGAPAEERFVPVSSRRTLMTFLMEEEEDLKRLASVFGREKLRELAVMWYQGAVFQLTRMPTDIVVEKELYDSLPELRSVQQRMLRGQWRSAIGVLSPDASSYMPRRIHYASNVMNYAFFKILEDHFRLEWTAPYLKTVFLFDGGALAETTRREYGEGHAGDRAMIDRWSGQVGLEGWYEWIPWLDRP
jgi:hypothetical protein